MQLNKKYILITGAGTGIGRALAQAFATEGAKIILCGRRLDPLIETQQNLPKNTVSHIIQADITKSEDRSKLLQAVNFHFGKLDLLINNAGIVPVGDLRSLKDDDLEMALKTNLLAPIALSRDCLAFLKHGKNSRIVNIGSMFGDIAFPLFATYSATKFGLRGFSDALRRELRAENIAVTYVAPRATKTPAASHFQDLVPIFDMQFDNASDVANHIICGLQKNKNYIYPKGWEKLFILIQRLCPKLIDNNLIKQLSNRPKKMA